MENLTKSSLYWGIALFIICSLLLIAKAPFVLVWVVLSPGIIMPVLLINNYKEGLSPLSALTLILLSETIYVGCFYFLDLRTNSPWLGLRLVILSGAGAILLKLCYDALISKHIAIKQTFLWPLLIGVISALPSSICAFFFNGGDSTIQNLYCSGIFLIYPTWYFGFAAYINHCKRSTEMIENPSN
jgi:hypothetical protein